MKERLDRAIACVEEALGELKQDGYHYPNETMMKLVTAYEILQDMRDESNT